MKNIIELESIKINQWILLQNLLQLYAYDFSEFTNDDVDECGNYNFGRLARHHWNDKNPDPIIIKINKKIGGFVLVKTENTKKEKKHAIAEFFVMKKFRKQGIGQYIAFEIFDMFPGNWYLDILKANVPAQNFWNKVITRYTNNSFKTTEDKENNKFIFTFITRPM